MDYQGYESVKAALSNAEVQATIIPPVQEGEDIRYVTIETDAAVAPARVLNALGARGLLVFEGAPDHGDKFGPDLKVLGVQPGSMTLEDRNVHRW